MGKKVKEFETYQESSLPHILPQPILPEQASSWVSRHACTPVCAFTGVRTQVLPAPHTVFILSSTMLHIPFSLLVVLVLPRTSLLVYKNKPYFFGGEGLASSLL